MRKSEVTRRQLERAARMYRTNRDATRALGVGNSTFYKLCRQFDIEMPVERMRRVSSTRRYDLGDGELEAGW